MSEPEKWFQHCSHSQHKLKEVYSNTKFRCQVCKHEDEGLRYRCDSCTSSSSFEIDTICATLTERLSSFAHPEHPLALRPTPFLLHRCRLCRGFVTGMVYRCEAHGCKFFLHPLCSQLPPELYENHHRHPAHRLRKREPSSNQGLSNLNRAQTKPRRCRLSELRAELSSDHAQIKPGQNGLNTAHLNPWSHVYISCAPCPPAKNVMYVRKSVIIGGIIVTYVMLIFMYHAWLQTLRRQMLQLLLMVKVDFGQLLDEWLTLLN